jgi:hypothetical protein
LLNAIVASIGGIIEEDLFQPYCVGLFSQTKLIYYIEFVMLFEDRLRGDAGGFALGLLLLDVVGEVA